MKSVQTITVQMLLGAGIFYFLVHPFTMVLYWFEFSHTPFSFTLFQEVLKERFLASFSFDMQGMGGLLTLLGGLLGMASGLFWINLRRKNKLIGTAPGAANMGFSKTEMIRTSVLDGNGILESSSTAVSLYFEPSIANSIFMTFYFMCYLMFV